VARTYGVRPGLKGRGDGIRREFHTWDSPSRGVADACASALPMQSDTRFVFGQLLFG